MTNFLQTDFSYQNGKLGVAPRFPNYDKNISDRVCALYQKYHEELVSLSEMLVHVRKDIHQSYGGCPGFCDVEAEFLYILIRETKPSTVFEISSRHGFTTNFAAAALAKNGHGRLECFEITDSYSGVPSEEVIRNNISDRIDNVPMGVNIGDARIEVTKKLKELTPDFVILDSLHTDVFAEYYVKVLFKCVTGSIYIQDINHYGPRPEWASEAYYKLNHLMTRGNTFLPIALYENDINASGYRKGITPHRMFRSSSIFLTLPNTVRENYPATEDFLNLFEHDRSKILDKNLSAFPINALDLNVASDLKKLSVDDGDNYFAPMFLGILDKETVNHASLMAVLLGKAHPDDQFLDNLIDLFEKTDSFHRVIILSALANNGRQNDAVALYTNQKESCVTSGLDIKLILARALMACGQVDSSKLWLEKCCDQGADSTLTGAPMQFYQAALLASKMGLNNISRSLINAAFQYVQVHEKAGIEPPSVMRMARLLYRLCFRRPRMLIHALRSGFPKLGMVGGFIDFVRFDLIPRLKRTYSS